jgi:hypothetical protein
MPDNVDMDWYLPVEMAVAAQAKFNRNQVDEHWGCKTAVIQAPQHKRTHCLQTS